MNNKSRFFKIQIDSKINCPSISIIAMFLLSLVMVSYSHAAGITRDWIVNSGVWDVPAHWSPYGVPVGTSNSNTAESAWLHHSDNIDRDITYHNSSSLSLYTTSIDNAGDGHTRLFIDQDRLGMMGYLYLGINGSGEIIQGGGIVSGFNTKLGVNQNAMGRYELNDGDFYNYHLTIGNSGEGIFIQRGGSHTSNISLGLGFLDDGIGIYEMQGGTLTVGELLHSSGSGLIVAQSGTFTQTGGQVHVKADIYGSQATGGLNIRPVGTYNLSGGLGVSLNSEIAKIQGTFNQDGGTFTVITDSPQTFGTLELAKDSRSNATYNMTFGMLVVDQYEYLSKGSGSVSVFNQSGGTHEIRRDLYIAPGTTNVYSSVRTATYNLSGNSQLLAENQYLGLLNQSSGTFNHSGGLNTVYETLTIASEGDFVNSLGIYNLSGGSLSTGNIVNNDTFNFNGGNLFVQTAGSFTNNGEFNIYGPDNRVINGNIINNATLNITDTNVTIIGALINNGGLIKTTDSSVFWTGNSTIASGYISDPSSNSFIDLTIEPSGYLVGGLGDEFIVHGDLHIMTENDNWDTTQASLIFKGTNTHNVQIADTASNENYAWSMVQVYEGSKVNVVGSDIYVDVLIIRPDSALELDGSTLHYNRIENKGGELVLSNGGQLMSRTPLCESDFDNDGDVDGSDLAVFQSDFGGLTCNKDCQGDFDNDGDVDDTDLAVISEDFGRLDCPIISESPYKFSIITQTGVEYQDFNTPALNNNGTVVFWSELTTGEQAIVKGTQSGLTKIVKTGRDFVDLDNGSGNGPSPAINDNGVVAFWGEIFFKGVEGIYIGPNPITDVIADTTFSYDGLGHRVAINNSGTIAFLAIPKGTNSRGIFTGPNADIDKVSSGTDGLIGGFYSAPSINDKDTVAFVATRVGEPARSIFIGPNPDTDTYVDWKGLFNDFPLNEPSINDLGVVVFRATLDNGESGVFIKNVLKIHTIADTSGAYSRIGLPAINDNNLVVFSATLDSGETGIYKGSNPEKDAVFRAGIDDLGFAKTIIGVGFSKGINDQGQVAFLVVFSDGNEAIVLATPTQ